MGNINPTVYTNGFFGSFLKSPTQMGLLSVNNSVTNISRLGTFKEKVFANFNISHSIAAAGLRMQTEQEI
jgi:hypothetical protein